METMFVNNSINHLSNVDSLYENGEYDAVDRELLKCIDINHIVLVNKTNSNYKMIYTDENDLQASFLDSTMRYSIDNKHGQKLEIPDKSSHPTIESTINMNKRKQINTEEDLTVMDNFDKSLNIFKKQNDNISEINFINYMMVDLKHTSRKHDIVNLLRALYYFIHKENSFTDKMKQKLNFYKNIKHAIAGFVSENMENKIDKYIFKPPKYIKQIINSWCIKYYLNLKQQTPFVKSYRRSLIERIYDGPIIKRRR